MRKLTRRRRPVLAMAARSRLRRILSAESLEPRHMLAADVPGDTLSEAHPISLVPGVMSTYDDSVGNGLHGDSDVDFYEVTLSTGQSLTVDIDTPYSSLDSYVRLFDSSGGEQASNNDDSSGYGSLDSFLTFTAPVSGTYFVSVSGNPNTSYSPSTGGSGTAGSTGSYSLKFTASQTASTIPSISLGTTQNEVQQVVLPTATGGSWTLDFDGQSTAAIGYGATAAEMQSALEDLSNLATGDVSVSGAGTDASPYLVTFQGELANSDVAQLTADGSQLLGVAAAISTTLPGSPGVNEVQMSTFG
ncbi:MAG: PPC domain-containing protein [Candidatus Paceibacterota bacterium]